ncbi:hypothetical protein C8R41DRAFT_851522 [Lentinula lateritia]|uniref:Uncharacterized protein n=1 Tax=Lentinula lateritia TaxID=40482 RepID=A0ABQ8V2P7_9AGAR|nr:hypothetical protein C8R41DRAFT_851522 [Lentinula lateritia]
MKGHHVKDQENPKSIGNITKDITDDDEATCSPGSDIDFFSMSLIEKCKDQTRNIQAEYQELDPLLWQNIKILCNTLKEIYEFTDTCVHRNIIIRFLCASADAERVLEYQGNIKKALDMFNLRATIMTQQVIMHMCTQQNLLSSETSVFPEPGSKTPYFLPFTGTTTGNACSDKNRTSKTSSCIHTMPQLQMSLMTQEHTLFQSYLYPLPEPALLLVLIKKHSQQFQMS